MLTKNQTDFITTHGNHWENFFEYNPVGPQTQTPDKISTFTFEGIIVAILEKAFSSLELARDINDSRESEAGKLNQAQESYGTKRLLALSAFDKSLPFAEAIPTAPPNKSISDLVAADARKAYTEFYELYLQLKKTYPDLIRITDTGFTIDRKNTDFLNDDSFKAALNDLVEFFVSEHLKPKLEAFDAVTLTNTLTEHLIYALAIRQQIKDLVAEHKGDKSALLMAFEVLRTEKPAPALPEDDNILKTVSKIIKKIRVSLSLKIQPYLPESATSINTLQRLMPSGINDFAAADEKTETDQKIILLEVLRNVNKRYKNSADKKLEFTKAIGNCRTAEDCFKLIITTAQHKNKRGYTIESLAYILLFELYNSNKAKDLVFYNSLVSLPTVPGKAIEEWRSVLRKSLPSVIESSTTPPRPVPSKSPVPSNSSGGS